MAKPKTSPSAMLSIQQEPAQMSRAQIRFNSLTAAIEKHKAKIAEWQEVIERHTQKVAANYLPLLDEYREQRIELVTRFDQLHDHPAMKKSERKKLAAIICDIIEMLLVEIDDDDLDAIHARHNPGNRIPEPEGEEAIKAAFEAMFDLEPGEWADFDNAEQMERIFAQKRQAAEERERQRQANRKKTPKELAEEAKQAQAEKELTQSIRSVFRKLVAALHPDREPDPKEAARKTQLMQRANLAYDNKDLFQLLALQLETEQINQAELDTFSEERLFNYNKVLNDQANQLKSDLARLELQIKIQFELSPGAKLSPRALNRFLNEDIKILQAKIRAINLDIQELDDVGNLKVWLKSYRPPRKQRLGEALFDDDLFTY